MSVKIIIKPNPWTPNFQRIFVFSLQNLPADNLKGLKTRTESWYQKHKKWNGEELQCVRSLASAFLNSKNILSQNKTDHIQFIRLQCV